MQRHRNDPKLGGEPLCGTHNPTIDNLNRIADTGYSYDAAGNMTAEPGKTYQYDAKNRLTTINSGAVATYKYNAAGQRIIKIVGNTTTSYFYDPGGGVVAEWSATPGGYNGWGKGYVYLGGQLLAQYDNTVSPATTFFVHKDHLGSTRLLTKLDKTPLESPYDYLPFGEPIGPSGSGTTHKFTGKERDTESNLDYFGARYYASAHGRFSSADPLLITRERMGDSQNLNLYSYVRNNPLRHIDPDGLDLIIYEFYSKDLTDEQRKWLEQNKQAIRDAIAAKYKEAGVEKVEFRDGSTLSEKQIREAIENEPTGVSFLNFANTSFAGKESGGRFGATDDIRSVVFLGNLIDSNTDLQTGILRVSEVGSHEIGHGQKLESNWLLFKLLPPILNRIVDRARNNLMDESRPKPVRPARIDTNSDINQRVIREINRIGDNTPKP